LRPASSFSLGPRHGRVTKVEGDEICQVSQFSKPGVGHAGAGQVEGGEIRQAGKFLHTRVGNGGVAEVEGGEVFEGRRVPSVRHRSPSCATGPIRMAWSLRGASRLHRLPISLVPCIHGSNLLSPPTREGPDRRPPSR